MATCEKCATPYLTEQGHWCREQRCKYPRINQATHTLGQCLLPSGHAGPHTDEYGEPDQDRHSKRAVLKQLRKRMREVPRG